MSVCRIYLRHIYLHSVVTRHHRVSCDKHCKISSWNGLDLTMCVEQGPEKTENRENRLIVPCESSSLYAYIGGYSDLEHLHVKYISEVLRMWITPLN